MPKLEIGTDGAMLLTLEEGESLCIRAGGSSLNVSAAGGGTLTALLGGAVSPATRDAATAPGKQPAPVAHLSPSPSVEPLTAPDAVLEILNAFQQVNVKARQMKLKPAEDAPEHSRALNALKAEAMERVLEICQRYTRSRGSEPLPEEPMSEAATLPPDAPEA